MAEFLPLCEKYISGLSKPCARTKAIYLSNFANPEVTRLLTGKSVLDVATMDEVVTRLLNVTLAGYQDVYRGNVRRVIAGTLDQAVNKGIIPRHALGGSSLARVRFPPSSTSASRPPAPSRTCPTRPYG